jgi:hypothetical protein
MVKGILSTTVISVILFSGCTATTNTEVKPEATKAKVKKEVKAKVKKEATKVKAKSIIKNRVSTTSITAKTVPASEFFKTK